MLRSGAHRPPLHTSMERLANQYFMYAGGAYFNASKVSTRAFGVEVIAVGINCTPA
ncbi:hypothetical protein AAKU55_003317 [Oxalobacteraceae bacterium GrIS 1.11]